MKKPLAFFLAMICLPLLIGANSAPEMSIRGIEGKILDNITSRLVELNQSKPLAQQSDEELRQQIEEAMQPYGYFKPQIKLLRQPLQITIKAGPQLHITNLSLGLIGEGAQNAEIKKTLANLPIAKGKPFNSENYEEAKQNLRDIAEHQGYVHSSFEKAEILIDTIRYTAKISLLFNTGPRYYFGQIQFDPTYISPKLLQRYIPFSSGQPYSTEQILTFNNQLANSGYFSSIAVKPEIMSTTNYVPVKVQLQPASRVSYSVGVGYGTDTQVRGRLGYHVVPVNPAGHKFNAIALGSFGQNLLQAQYIIPGKNPVIDEFHLTGNLSTLDYDSGYSKSALVSLAQHHNLDQYRRVLSINGLYDGYHYYRQPSQENFTFFPKVSITWLKTNDKLFSPSGYNLSFAGLGATKLLASKENFVQATLNVKAALTVESMRTRFYLHSFQGITEIHNINRLPFSLAMLLGGAENLKAFSFNSIGPGKILSYIGLEIQKETLSHWYLIGFFDRGDVYNPNPKAFKNDLGLGLMWVSPVGPIKIGIAQQVDSHLSRQGKGPKFVLSMGPDL